MIPNLRMDYYHQKEYLERPYNIQMGEKLARKPLKVPMEGFEYSSLLTSKTYSILSYIVGGFVGSKSQMNNNKHSLSYDLSTAIFNLLNPCKYEREKGCRKSSDNLYSTSTKISTEGYDKYIVNSSQKEKMVDLGLDWFENYMLGFSECCDSSQTGEDSLNCDEVKVSSGSKINLDIGRLENCSNTPIDMTDRVSACKVKIPEENLDQSVNCLTTERFRQCSECSMESTDSENFIVFDNSDQDDEKKSETNWKLEKFDSDSEDENNDDDSDDEDDDNDDDDDDDHGDGDDDDDDVDVDVVDYNKDDDDDDYDIYSLDKELAEANNKWKRNYENIEMPDDVGERKVRFNENVKVNKIVAWDYAYRAARPGPWEQMARDRVRFRERILRLSPIISTILRKEHRDKIYKELYS